MGKTELHIRSNAGMKSHPTNCSHNSLPAGLQEQDLLAAITSSGYPLQGVVAAKLLSNFHVTEEWGFVDDETREHRSLDINAYRALSDPKESHGHKALRLLIECKRSRHPFVFFQQVVSQSAPEFPYIGGVPNGAVSIHEKQNSRYQEVTPAHALGLESLPFVQCGPPICAAFTKAIASGKKVELSGSDPFSTIVLPLVKAFRYAVTEASRPRPEDPIWPTLTLCITVLDAPMLVVESPDSADDPVLRPWVRVVRHESNSERHSRRSRFYTIDFVHAEYFSAFLTEHLLPFATEFAVRASSADGVLRFGGNVPSLNNWTWDQVKARPKL